MLVFFLKMALKLKELLQTDRDFYSFEYLDVQIKSASSRIVRILTVYRLPSSNSRNRSTELFLDEFGSLLEQYIADPAHLLIAGDFNYHVDVSSDRASSDFLALLDSFNLKQHVCDSTHRAGHTLRPSDYQE